MWRVLKASGAPLSVARNLWKLYISELHYGSLGQGDQDWDDVEGRYVLAFLFEYVATLGLLDVAYICADGARNDFRTLWGTDDLSALSRYDGLMFVRINSLGAWCLGLSETYQPEERVQRPVVKVLANFDVVVSNPPLEPGDALLLERFTERTSEAVWRLDQAKILAAVEEGLTVSELREFLTARSQGPLPATVGVFLDDVAARAGRLEDLALHGWSRAATPTWPGCWRTTGGCVRCACWPGSVISRFGPPMRRPSAGRCGNWDTCCLRSGDSFRSRPP